MNLLFPPDIHWFDTLTVQSVDSQYHIDCADHCAPHQVYYTWCRKVCHLQNDWCLPCLPTCLPCLPASTPVWMCHFALNNGYFIKKEKKCLHIHNITVGVLFRMIENVGSVERERLLLLPQKQGAKGLATNAGNGSQRGSCPSYGLGHEWSLQS